MKKVFYPAIIPIILTLWAHTALGQTILSEYPHNETNGLECGHCHFVYGAEEKYWPPEVLHEPDPNDIDDTKANQLCESCHNDGIAPRMEPHSSQTTDDSYGTWNMECRRCHTVHEQQQFREYGAESHLASGASTDIDPDPDANPTTKESTLTLTGATWTVDQFVNMDLIPNLAIDYYSYKITRNTADTLTVEGEIDMTKATIGDTFAVVYGNLVKVSMPTPVYDPIAQEYTEDVAYRDVKFLVSEGNNSLADGSAPRNGPCEVCHSRTTHFRFDGTGSDQTHNNVGGTQGLNCTELCHKHVNGFAHGSCGEVIGCHGDQPSHKTHTGPILEQECDACHDYENIPLFSDGQDLANTTACDGCHTPAGAAIAKGYFRKDDEAVKWWDDPGMGGQGQGGYCGSCHKENSQSNQNGYYAANIVGDAATYGFYVNGHGVASGNLQTLSWQAVEADGNPAPNRICDNCHDLTSGHFSSGSGSVKRLKAGWENDDNNSNCKKCHDPSGGTDYIADNEPYYLDNSVGADTFGRYDLSAHGQPLMPVPGGGTRKVKCSDCHDVHGASGNNVGMTTLNKEALCYDCHTDQIVRNDAISGGALADDIQEAFSFAENNQHTMGAPYFFVKAEGTHNNNLENQSVLVDTAKAWAPGELVGKTIHNKTDGISGVIVSNTATTVTAAPDGGGSFDWDDNGGNSECVAGYLDCTDVGVPYACCTGFEEGDGTCGNPYPCCTGEGTGACTAGEDAYYIEGDHYELNCVSCHNVHLVTGKYWDADLGVSPVSEVADPLNIWGDEAGEKMDDYAASGSGIYRAPKEDPFSGAELPGYTPFCQGCHEAMPGPQLINGEHGSLDFDEDPHGLQSANMPNGYGVCPNWYGCGKAENWDNDDCIGTEEECWPVLSRFKGDQIGTRTPYNHEERIAGVNFALSCTDCHEAHGSPVRSLIRTNPNDGTGTIAWNDMCNNCHYYYSDWHAGMSCPGCHPIYRSTGTTTLHEMGSRYGTGATRTINEALVLHYGFENNLKDSSQTWQLDGIWSLDRHNPSNQYACLDVGDPWACCTGPRIGDCDEECTAVDVPYPCCTGAGKGMCDDDDKRRVCPTVDDATKRGSFVTGRAGNGKAISVSDMPIEVGTEDCLWTTDAGYHGTWVYTEMKYNMTLEAWVNPSVDDGERKIMAKHTYWNGGYALLLEKVDGTLRVGLNTFMDQNRLGCNGLRGAYSSVSIPLNEWTHVAATFDADGPDRNDNDGSVGRIRIYVNGEDVTDSSSILDSCYAQPGAGETAMFPHSDWNDTPEMADICYPGNGNGHWCASAFSIGGVNWSDTNNNFIGKLDEVKVYNVTQPLDDEDADGHDPEHFNDIDASIGPYISSVEVGVGSDQVTVAFSEEIYTATGTSGSLVAGDFSLDAGGRTIQSVAHTAGDKSAVLTLSSAVTDPNDIIYYALAMVSGEAFDDDDKAASTSLVYMTPISACPTSSPVIIDLNQPAGTSAIFQDNLFGVVNDPSGSFTGNGYFTGDGVDNYITFDTNATCLQATNSMTLEARIKPTGIGSSNYIARVLARDSGGANYQMSVWRNTSWSTYNAPAGEASIALWVKPTDAHGGNAWKVALSNYSGVADGSENNCPIVSDHWYHVKVVWNSGNSGIPVDIFIDDQGTDGLGAGEGWAGLLNCTDSDQDIVQTANRMATGDTITPVDGPIRIGANVNNGNNQFNGVIEWIKWQ